ncbi:hypothetical protein GC173_14085 [bacterium]|nr:hypothetical protein [bacterium]
MRWTSSEQLHRLPLVMIAAVFSTWIAGFILLSAVSDEVLGNGRAASWPEGVGVCLGLLILLGIARWADRRAEHDPAMADEISGSRFHQAFLALFILVGAVILTQGIAVHLNAVTHGPEIEREVAVVSKSARRNKDGSMTWLLRLGTGPADPLRERAVQAGEFERTVPGKTRFVFRYCEGALGMPVLIGWHLVDEPA